MTTPFGKVPLGWRLFLTSSITVTLVFAGAGWALQKYALRFADQGVRSEIQSSMQAYEAVWKARTQLLAASTAVMSSMSDVRAAFMTRDAKTIRDSADEIWSRVSENAAVFLVLGPTGDLITALGKQEDQQLAAAIHMADIADRFPKQVAGYVKVDGHLDYVVLTPVYVQTSSDPVLLNVLCAGFRIDDALVRDLHKIAPGSDFVFADASGIFATTLPEAQHLKPLLVSRRPLSDLGGRPIGELRILRRYDTALNALADLRRSLALLWAATIVLALLISSYLTRRLLLPIKTLDHAAAEIASGNYGFRVSIRGDDELTRFARTFNQMCDSVQRAQAELRSQEQMSTISRLGTSLVHDLRNPLAAVYGGAEMLIDGNLPPQQTTRIANNIYKASQRIQELLQDLVNVSKAGTRSLEVCRLRDILDAARDSVATSLSGVSIDIQIPESLEVLTDRTRIERVFSNLLSNAQQAIPGSGFIRVYLLEQSGFLDVFIEDSGTGIPDAIKARLFEPFVTGRRNGMGLGLALARRTMLDLGGDLSLEDRPRGACFRVRFRMPELAKEVPPIIRSA